HGASALHTTMAGPTFRSGQFTVLTWGLLGPGKGIEWGIEAMAMLRDLAPRPRYMVAGQTHPKVLLHEGDVYRDRLREQVRRADLGSWITFDGHYRNTSALASPVRSADVVLLPYDSTEQVTSGVLIEAVAAGKPVGATQFPHAREVLAGGAGLLVPHRDPTAIAAALRSLMTRGDVLARVAAAATAAAPQLLWPGIAGPYPELGGRLIKGGGGGGGARRVPRAGAGAGRPPPGPLLSRLRPGRHRSHGGLPQPDGRGRA